MRITFSLAAGLALGFVAVTAVRAAPAMPQPHVVLGSAATAVDWHPSRSHWDHHYHSHQRVEDQEVIEAEPRIRRGSRLRNPEWSGYHPYAGRRVHHY